MVSMVSEHNGISHLPPIADRRPPIADGRMSNRHNSYRRSPTADRRSPTGDWQPAIGAVALMLRPPPNGAGAGPNGLPPALAKALGVDNGPKEFLEIERLNEKLGSFEYSFNKASTSPAFSAAETHSCTVSSLPRSMLAHLSDVIGVIGDAI